MSHPLAQGGVFLVINGALTALLGVAYWIEAARLFGQATVGRNSALISAMLTLSGLAQLNYVRALSGLVPRAGSRSPHVVVRTYVVAAALSLVGGSIFVLAGPHASARLHYLSPFGPLATLFVVSTSLWSVFALEDAVLASARSTPVIVVENAGFGLIKLLLLYVFAQVGVGQYSVFISWVAPLLVIVVLVNWYVFRRALPRMTALEPDPAPPGPAGARWVRYDLAGYVLWLLGTITLPLIVLSERGPRASAVFYVSLTMILSVDALSLNLGNALTAEMSRAAGPIPGRARLFVQRACLLVAAISLLLVALAPEVLAIFGARYREHGVGVLRLLAAASVLRACVFMGVAVARAQGQGPRILAIQAVASVGTIGLGVPMLSAIGIDGLALAWLAASAAAAVLALQGLWSTVSKLGTLPVRFG